MKKCQHSGNICRAEELLRIINPDSIKNLVEKYCLGDKELCNQYREIEDKGIGFAVNFANFIESAHGMYKQITKKVGEV